MLGQSLRRVGQRAGFSTAPNNQLTTQLRSLLRQTAQPVAVITSLLRSPESPNVNSFHGATLSSFSSIAMDPYPLVAFSLRIPSRMATSLTHAFSRKDALDYESDMVINILSAAQASTAVLFSRPDLHRNPFEEISYSLNSDGIPILEQSLGALSCKLALAPIPLDDIGFSGPGMDLDSEQLRSESVPGSGESTSELFIARVTWIETLPLDLDDDIAPNDARALPLLYHRRGYSTCSSDLMAVP